MVWDLEKAPLTTNRRQLEACGIHPPTSLDGMDDIAVALALREVATGLGWIRCRVINTAGFDDRTVLTSLLPSLDEEIRECLSPFSTEFLDPQLMGVGAPDQELEDPRFPTLADLDRWRETFLTP